MAGSVLAGRYITNTDDFLSVTDERSLIQSADDPKAPGTTSSSFAQLEAEAPGNPATAAVLEDLLEVINKAVADAEGTVETFGGGRYALPFSPIDPMVKSLAVRWAWISLRERRRVLSQRDADDARDAIRRIGDKISAGAYTLVSSAAVVTADGGPDFYAGGSQDRAFSREIFTGINPLPGDRRLTWKG